VYDTKGRKLNLDRVIAALTIPRNATVQKIEKPIVPAHPKSIADNRKSLMG
jgi:hypothetical protein